MATITIACDDNNDIAFADGRNIAFLSGSDACAQNLKQKSLMRLGEDQYNTADGVDYFGTIFTPQPDYDAARQTITRNLLRCPDVISIQSLTIDVELGIFVYVAQVSTIYGPIKTEGQQSL